MMSVEVDENVWNSYQNLLFKVMKFAGKQLVLMSKMADVPIEITNEYDNLNKEVIELCFPSSSKLKGTTIKFPIQPSQPESILQPQAQSNNHVEQNNNIILKNLIHTQPKQCAVTPEIFVKKAVHKPTAKVKRLYSNESFACKNCSKVFKLQGDLKIHGVVCTQKRNRKIPQIAENHDAFQHLHVKKEINQQNEVTDIFKKESVTVEEIENFLRRSKSTPERQQN